MVTVVTCLTRQEGLLIQSIQLEKNICIQKKNSFSFPRNVGWRWLRLKSLIQPKEWGGLGIKWTQSCQTGFCPHSFMSKELKKRCFSVQAKKCEKKMQAQLFWKYKFQICENICTGPKRKRVFSRLQSWHRPHFLSFLKSKVVEHHFLL